MQTSSLAICPDSILYLYLIFAGPVGDVVIVLIRSVSLICNHLVVHVCATARLPIVLMVSASCGPALSELGHIETAKRNRRANEICDLLTYRIVAWYGNVPGYLELLTVPYQSSQRNTLDIYTLVYTMAAFPATAIYQPRPAVFPARPRRVRVCASSETSETTLHSDGLVHGPKNVVSLRPYFTVSDDKLEAFMVILVIILLCLR